jgi:signal transduction histidine kinase
MALKDASDPQSLDDRDEEARRIAAEVRSAAGVVMWRYDSASNDFEVDPDIANPSSGEARGRQGAAAAYATIHPDERSGLIANLKASLATGVPGEGEYRHRPAGRSKWRRRRITWRRVRSRTGEGWDLLGAVQDITELVEARDAALRGEQAARAAAEAKIQFLANISHEFRTPMNGVLGVLHLIKAEPPPAERKRLIEQGLAAAGGLSDLLNDIIDFSDVEAGRLQLAPEALDPARILKDLVASFQTAAHAKGLTLTVRVQRNLGWVAVDGARLRRIFLHYVSNAVKFTVQGSIEARLSASGEGESRRLRFEVRDTGVGVAPEARADLFQHFSQADSSTTRAFGGPGLGLAIARRLADLMGGQVGFVSASGGGSIFWAEVSAPAAAKPAPAEAVEDDAWLAGVRVLVVEDNPTNRLIATGILNRLGAEVVTAENGAEGVAAMEQSDFDLVFMDIQMPVMDGCEASRRIRALPGPKSAVPIVATTANVLPQQLAAYRDCGINGVVSKPISPAALLAEVVKVAQAVAA